MRAKVAQEKLLTESGLPYTIVRATQFAEFADADHRIDDGRRRGARPRRADPADRGGPGRLRRRARRRREPLNGIVNIGGPEKIPFEQMARESLARQGDDSKTVVVDPEAGYFGTALRRNSLVTPD